MTMFFRRTILLALFFTSILLCGASGVEVPHFETEEALGSLNWTSWRTLPVYDDGRIMPLNTFSRILVTQICGVPDPKLIVDDILYSNIEAVLSLKLKGDPSLIADEAARIRKRIDELFPHGERTFKSYELLFSWLVEPEVWDFIPFLAHSKAYEFRAEVLSAARINQKSRYIRFIAPIQLETSSGYFDLLDRVRERQMQVAHQSRENGDTQHEAVKLSEYETIAVDLHKLHDAYQALTYRSEPTLPEFSSTFLLAMRNIQEGFRSASQSWNRLSRLGLDRKLPEREITLTERFNALALIIEQIRRQIQDQETQIILLLKLELQLDAILKITEGAFADSEEIYQLLYNSPNAFASRAKEVREDAVLFHSSLVLLRRATQAAYLSLYQTGRTIRILPALYDDVLRPDVAGSSGFGSDMRSVYELPDTSPWVSLNLVLRAGPATIRRFVDRDFPLYQEEHAILSELFGTELYFTFSPALKDLLQKPVVFGTKARFGMKAQSENRSIEISPEKSESFSSLEENTRPSISTDLLLDRLVQESQEKLDAKNQAELLKNSTVVLRKSFLEFSKAYCGKGGLSTAHRSVANWVDIPQSSEKLGSRFVRWDGAMIQFALSVRETAHRMETVRHELLPADKSDPAHLMKTAYPEMGALNIEYLYSRFNPFYWMGITAGIGLVFLFFSFALEWCRRIGIDLSSLLSDFTGEKGAKWKKASPEKLQRVAQVRRLKEQVRQGKELSPDSLVVSGEPGFDASVYEPFHRLHLVEELLLWGGIFFLLSSVLTTLLGGILRACISGWAPVSNMFETIVLMAFVAACLGLWLTLQPLLAPPLARSWRLSAFPWKLWWKEWFPSKKAEVPRSENTEIAYSLHPSVPEDSLEVLKRTILALFRVLLTFLTLLAVLFVSYHEYSDGQGLIDAVFRSFAMNDPIDWLVVFGTLCTVVWLVPRVTLTCLLIPLTLFVPSRLKHLPVEDTPDSALIQGVPPQKMAPSSLSPLAPEAIDSLLKGPYQQVAQSDGSFWWFQARHHILHRKTFVLAGILIVCLAAMITQYNPREFNPNIRPLAAVLRSNFWLAVHVFAIMIGYAAGLIAWLLALASLSMYIFGHYRKVEYGKSGIVVLPPYFCDTLAPHIRKMLMLAVWMVMIGTVLGARWADYSWGRFWSWDVKEVWALITLLLFLFVLHGRKARFYGELGVTIGAVFGAIAILVTWYGFNFVFNVGRHAYGHGDSSWATYFLLGFIVVNVAWTAIAVGRYMVENVERRRKR